MDPITLPALDAWLASSLLQKAIRRGEVVYATAAAAAFHRMRGNAIWRRLLLIAFEDIGPADPKLCIRVTDYATDPLRRKRDGGDKEVLLSLVTRMCATAKHREADYLICAAKQAPFTEGIRAAYAARSTSQQVVTAGDPQTPLLERSVAAWMASGVNGGGPHVLSVGDLSNLMTSFAELGVPAGFTSSALVAAQRTKEPIVVMSPLLHLAIGDATIQITEDVRCPPYVLCNGVPSWAFDKHTRVGLSAIRRLILESAEVNDCISNFVPDYRAIEVAAMGAFYADAIFAHRRMTWLESENLYSLGLRTDFAKIGTPDDGILPIAAVIGKNIDHLNDIRKRLREGRLQSSRSKAYPEGGSR